MAITITDRHHPLHHRRQTPAVVAGDNMLRSPVQNCILGVAHFMDGSVDAAKDATAKRCAIIHD